MATSNNYKTQEQAITDIVINVLKLASEYDASHVDSILDNIKADKTDTKDIIILRIINDTLYQYDLSKKELLLKDRSGSEAKKYARIVIVTLIKEYLPTYTNNSIRDVLCLSRSDRVTQLALEGRRLSERVPSDKFALSV